MSTSKAMNKAVPRGFTLVALTRKADALEYVYAASGRVALTMSDACSYTKARLPHEIVVQTRREADRHLLVISVPNIKIQENQK